MTPLLDLNVLIALAWPNHVHHQVAHAWFARQASWATCPMTQTGFVRLSTHPRVSAGVASTADAVAVLKRIVDLPGHDFWSDDVALATLTAPLGHVMGHRQVTDVHLLLLAERHGGRLATLDRGLAVFSSAHRVGAVDLVRD